MKTRPSDTPRDRFNRAADAVTTALGSLPVLVGSVVLVLVWAITGPLFNFSDTWQLFINTTTTVITFWMVFVIQNSANRQGKATQLKLDELIRVLSDARNEFVTLDHESDEVLAEHEREFKVLVEEDQVKVARGRPKRVAQGSRATGRGRRPAKPG
jgi:low affinity Fe/Cu permease